MLATRRQANHQGCLAPRQVMYQRARPVLLAATGHSWVENHVWHPLGIVGTHQQHILTCLYLKCTVMRGNSTDFPPHLAIILIYCLATQQVWGKLQAAHRHTNPADEFG